jgi:two-component system, LytTR family, sensor kinase
MAVLAKPITSGKASHIPRLLEKVIRLFIEHVPQLLFWMIHFFFFSFLFKLFNSFITLNEEQLRKILTLTFLIGILVFYCNYVLSFYWIFRRLAIKGFLILMFFNLLLTVVYFQSILSILGIFDWKTHGVIVSPIWAALGIGYFSISGIIYRGYHYSIAKKEREHVIQVEQSTMELNLIKNQLNPHFLFNVLNNIDSYIRKDSDLASDTLIQLSGLMRYVLYQNEMVALQLEIQFVEDYISLQKQRVGQRVRCSFNKEIQDDQLLIAPAIFLPFIENAFKHYDDSENRAFISFQMIQSTDKIRFISRNSSTKGEAAGLVSDHKGGGLGLKIAEKRLQLLYPKRHKLLIENTGFEYSVILDLWTK